MRRYLNYIHPFLFATYPVLFLYSQNIHEYTEASIIIPLIFSLLFASIVFLISKLALGNIQKSAIISSFIIFVSLSFGRLTDILGIKTLKFGGQTFDKQVFFLAIVLILLSLIFWAIYKFKNALP